MNFSKIKQYFIESFQELGKVTWPTKNRAVNICILVVSFVVISAAVIAAIDFVFHEGYGYLLTLAAR
jgi:preprotein translocase SecE subunit